MSWKRFKGFMVMLAGVVFLVAIMYWVQRGYLNNTGVVALLGAGAAGLLIGLGVATIAHNPKKKKVRT